MKYKNIILSIVFTFVVIIIYFQWEKVIQIKRDEDHGQFFHEKNIDVVFIGTSKTWMAFSPMYIWDKYGIVSYNRGSSGQSYKMSYFLMKDAVENHNAKVIVFDISYLLSVSDPYESVISNILNMIPLTNRYQAYKELFGKDLDFDKVNIAARFHTRWKELKKNDFTYNSYMKGLYDYPFMRYDGEIKFSKHEVQLSPETIKYAKLFQEYADKNGVKLIFIDIPAINMDLGYGEAFGKLAKKEGWIYFNYNKLAKDIGFDYKYDLVDVGHTNTEGGSKILNHLIPYLISIYNLQSKKNDIEYTQWNNDYKKYMRHMIRKKIKGIDNIDDWFSMVYKDNYCITIISVGEIMSLIPKTIKDELNKMGLTKYNTINNKDNYIAIINDKNVVYEEKSVDKIEYKSRINDIYNLYVLSSPDAWGIKISGYLRSINQYGLNIVVYDNNDKTIVDSILLSPVNFKEIIRN